MAAIDPELIRPADYIGHTVGGCRLQSQVSGAAAWMFRAQSTSKSRPLRGSVFQSANLAVDNTVLVELAWPADAEVREALLHEATRWSESSLENVVQYRGADGVDDGELSGAVYLVTDSCGESLAELAASQRALGDKQARTLIQDVGRALAGIHSHGRVIGRITPLSIFLTRTGWMLRPTLQGISAQLNRKGPVWQPSDDIRSLGLALRECLNGVSTDVKSLVNRCLDEDRQDRPTATDLAFAFMELPEAVTDAAVERIGGTIEIRWTPPKRGEVRVLQLSSDQTFQPGATVPFSTVGQYGRVLFPHDQQSIRIDLDGRRDARVVMLAVNGPAAVVGCQFQLSDVPDVDRLLLTRTGERFSITWDWPQGINEVVVVHRNDRFPIHPAEEGTTPYRISRVAYSAQGVRIPIPRWGDDLYLTVFGVADRAGALRYSSGTSGGCRRHVPLRLCRAVVTYVVRPSPHSSRRDGHRFELLLGTDHPVELPELVLVGKPKGIPKSPDDGALLLRIPTGAVLSPEEITVFPVGTPTSYRQSEWHARLFPSDAELGRWLMLSPKRPQQKHRRGRSSLTAEEWLLILSTVVMLIGILWLAWLLFGGETGEARNQPTAEIGNDSTAVTDQPRREDEDRDADADGHPRVHSPQVANVPTRRDDRAEEPPESLPQTT